MQNPWLEIPDRAPFVLPDDVASIEAFNSKARPEHRIDLRSVPEPFIGFPDAPVVLLNANPGFREEVNADPVPVYTEASQANLRHERPFHLLDPVVCEHSGIEWWQRKLGPLVERCGLDRCAATPRI